MRIKALAVFNNFRDDTSLTSSISLNYSDRLSNFEALSHMESFWLDIDRLWILSYKMNITIMDLFDDTLAIFELALCDFYTISNLNIELRIISDCFAESIIIKEVPFILVIVF